MVVPMKTNSLVAMTIDKECEKQELHSTLDGENRTYLPSTATLFPEIHARTTQCAAIKLGERFKHIATINPYQEIFSRISRDILYIYLTSIDVILNLYGNFELNSHFIVL